jgi:hypothetical protein
MKRGVTIFLTAVVMFLCASGAAHAAAVTVPEIDGSSMASAITLLAGIGALMADQMRRQR